VGKGAAVLSDVEVYDPPNDSWQAAPPMALPRTSLAAAALGGRLYAVGGQTSRSTHDSVEWWEPGAGRWVQMGAAMQQPRKYHGLTAAGGARWHAAPCLLLLLLVPRCVEGYTGWLDCCC
jgi:hypothetical protein